MFVPNFKEIVSRTVLGQLAGLQDKARPAPTSASPSFFSDLLPLFSQTTPNALFQEVQFPSFRPRFFEPPFFSTPAGAESLPLSVSPPVPLPTPATPETELAPWEEELLKGAPYYIRSARQLWEELLQPSQAKRLEEYLAAIEKPKSIPPWLVAFAMGLGLSKPDWGPYIAAPIQEYEKREQDRYQQAVDLGMKLYEAEQREKATELARKLQLLDKALEHIERIHSVEQRKKAAEQQHEIRTAQVRIREKLMEIQEKIANARNENERMRFFNDGILELLQIGGKIPPEFQQQVLQPAIDYLNSVFEKSYGRPAFQEWVPFASVDYLRTQHQIGLDLNRFALEKKRTLKLIEKIDAQIQSIKQQQKQGRTDPESDSYLRILSEGRKWFSTKLSSLARISTALANIIQSGSNLLLSNEDQALLNRLQSLLKNELDELIHNYDVYDSLLESKRPKRMPSSSSTWMPPETSVSTGRAMTASQIAQAAQKYFGTLKSRSGQKSRSQKTLSGQKTPQKDSGSRSSGKTQENKNLWQYGIHLMKKSEASQKP